MKKLFLLIIVLLCATPAWATTYYVNKSGSDANSCATAQSAVDANAKLTVAAGAACLGAGDTLIIGDGTYAEVLTNPLPSGSNSSAPTIMQCENMRLCIIKPNVDAGSNIILLNANRNYIVFRGLKLDGDNLTSAAERAGIRSNSATVISGLIIEDSEILNLYGPMIVFGNATSSSTIRRNSLHTTKSVDLTFSNAGIYARGPDTVIEYNDIYAIGEYAVTLNSGNDCRNLIFRYNVLRDSSTLFALDSGLRALNITCPNALIHNNLIYGNGAHGINVTGWNGTRIYNNTIYGNGGRGILINAGVTDITAVNNIVLGNTTAQITDSSGNLVSTTNRTTGTVADIFIDAPNDIFSLKESSVAIDAGTVITGFSEGRCVGAGCDQGALEACIRASAVTENAAPTKYLISYSCPSQSVRNGVGLQTPTVANWAIRDDGAAMTENSATIIGTSVVEITLSASLTAGVIDDAYTRSTAPTLMDNQAIGDPNGSLTTNYQNAFVRTHAAIGGTNNIGGGGGATFNVVHFRQISWYASISSPTWKRLQDAAAGVQAGGKTAIAITIEGTGANPDATAFEMYYNTGGGDSIITDSVATNAIGFVNDAISFQDQAAISSLISGLTCPHVTFVAGAVVGKQTSQPNIDLSQDSCTTLILLLQTKSDATGTINIKPKLPGGTAISYGVTPSITIKKAEAGS